MRTLEDRLAALIAHELGIDASSMNASTRLADIGDSLDRVILLAALEEAFDFNVPSALDLDRATLGDLMGLLKEPANA